MIEFDSNPQNVSLVEPYVENVARQCHVSEEVYGNMIVALTEAVSNAILHGNCSNEAKKVRVTARQCKRSVTFVVEDEGKGFNPESIPDPTTPDRLLVDGGRGVFLMRCLCNKVNYRKAGTVVEIKFNL